MSVRVVGGVGDATWYALVSGGAGQGCVVSGSPTAGVHCRTRAGPTPRSPWPHAPHEIPPDDPHRHGRYAGDRQLSHHAGPATLHATAAGGERGAPGPAARGRGT